MKSDYQRKILELEVRGSLRQFRPLSDRNGCRIKYNGKKMLNMTSNDYLGIAGNIELQKEFYHGLNESGFLEKYGLGAASSRLLTGDNTISHELERCISQEYRRPACLLFNSGYHANIGILPALCGKRDLILSDKLNHASIHDGMRLSLATYKRFRHRDYHHLTQLLQTRRKDYEKVIIVSESVFSMDGDEADLSELVAIKNAYDCLLYVDEAHGVGLYGEKGLGKAEEAGVIDEIDLLIGTFGKAYASIGAFLLCNADIYAFLVNHSRSLIFTTALPPVIIQWNAYVFEHIVSMRRQRRHLQQISSAMRQKLRENNLQTAGSTNIVPVIIGDNQRAVTLAEKMIEAGFLIFPVRPPTVPEGTARFRLSLTADMMWQDIENIPLLIRQGLPAHENSLA